MHPALVYTLNQPEPYQSIMMHCMATIEACIPEIELRFSYKIPFYYYRGKPFCYLAPNHKDQFMDLGLTKGYQLTLHQDALNGDNRNTVKSIRYYQLETIDQAILVAVLEEAVSLY